ncbi:hypothetical protein [Arthrobacter sp. B6]|uniref:hypothetical protein n=1 Tax=Arthrobacter sp. B6 TaxID=1570137 RepID=UPI000835692E|nr:hypothetical protein [Arthrobacter sp. B6]
MTLGHSKRRRAGARGVSLTAALVLAASLAGCGPADTGVQRDTARQLQELVLGVSQAAAANDHTAALTALDTLEADVAAAAGTGQVSEDRRRAIMTSITAVRADLIAAIDAAAAAAKAAQEAAAAAAAAEAEQARADAEAARQAAQEDAAPVVPVPAPPAPAPADPDPGPPPGQGKGNEGKGKNKDD